MRDWAKNQVEIFFIRHGYTNSNLEGRYLGITDEELCQKGIEMLLELKEQYNIIFHNKDIDCFVGPMQRCRKTAEIIGSNKQWKIIEEFTEIDFGEFEGKNYEDLSDDITYQKWIDSNGRMPFPKGESREDFIDRSMRGYKRLLEMIGENRKVCCILHGGNIMSILSTIGEKDYYDYQIKPGRGYRCLIDLEHNKLKEIEEV